MKAASTINRPSVDVLKRTLRIGLSLVLVITSISPQALCAEVQAPAPGSGRSAARMIINRLAVEFALKSLDGIKTTDQFIDRFFGDLPGSEKTALRREFPLNMAPQFSREGDRMIATLGEVRVVTDFSEVHDRRISLDGVKVILSKSGSIAFQVGLINKMYRNAHPDKFGVLDRIHLFLPPRFHSSVRLSNHLVADFSGGVPAKQTADELAEQVRKLVAEELEKAGSKAKGKAAILGKVTKQLASWSAAVGASVVFGAWALFEKNVCSFLNGGNFNEVTYENGCHDWAEGKRKEAMSMNQQIDLIGAILDRTYFNELMARFEVLTTKCMGGEPTQADRFMYRGFIRDRNQGDKGEEVWRFVVAEFEKEPGKVTKLARIREFGPNERPFFKDSKTGGPEAPPKNFPPVKDESRTLDNVKPRTDIKFDIFGLIISAELENPDYAAQKERNPAYAYRKVSITPAEANAPAGCTTCPQIKDDRLRSTIEMFKLIRHLVSYYGMSCEVTRQVIKDQKEAGVSEKIAPVITPEQAQSTGTVSAEPPPTVPVSSGAADTDRK